MATVHNTKMSAKDVRAFARQFGGILSGRLPDTHGIAHGFRMRTASRWLSLVKQAYIVKSRGGTDEAGISWAPNTARYLAYGKPRRYPGGPIPAARRVGGLSPGGKGNLTTMEAHNWQSAYSEAMRRSIGKIGAGARFRGQATSAGKKAAKKTGQGLDLKNVRDGFMTIGQLIQWKRIYGYNFARLRLQGTANAQELAAKIAWAKMKSLGVRTKLAAFGNRPDEILRDSGLLFNSLSPGTISESSDGKANYATNTPEQVVREDPGRLIVGTNIKYAAFAHNGKGRRHRALWPAATALPKRWIDELNKATRKGLALSIAALVQASR